MSLFFIKGKKPRPNVKGGACGLLLVRGRSLFGFVDDLDQVVKGKQGVLSAVVLYNVALECGHAKDVLQVAADGWQLRWGEKAQQLLLLGFAQLGRFTHGRPPFLHQ